MKPKAILSLSAIVATAIAAGLLFKNAHNPGLKYVFACKGNANTLITSFPLEVRIKDDQFTWSWDLSGVEKYTYGFMQIPIATKTYRLNTRHADGTLVKRIDQNTISINHFHVKATFFLDTCTLEYPAEIDSIQLLIKLLSDQHPTENKIHASQAKALAHYFVCLNNT